MFSIIVIIEKPHHLYFLNNKTLNYFASMDQHNYHWITGSMKIWDISFVPIHLIQIHMGVLYHTIYRYYKKICLHMHNSASKYYEQMMNNNVPKWLHIHIHILITPHDFNLPWKKLSLSKTRVSPNLTQIGLIWWIFLDEKEPSDWGRGRATRYQF
jgi:hypothetical protein